MDAIYSRQSVDKKDSISIETQIDLCKKHLDNPQKFEIFSDKGYSGSNTNRPEFQRLIEDVKAGRITRIITYRLDRISRSVLDFSNLFDLFEKHGVSFVSTQEQFDTTTAIGKAMLSIAMVFAQMERETIQQRIRDNYYARGEKGMYLGGPAPFGFVKAEIKTEQGKLKLLQENPETAAVLVALYSMYGNELKTLGEISRWLNSEEIPSPAGRNWDSAKVSRILRNPVSVKADADIYSYYRKRGCKFTNELSDYLGDKGCYLYGKREGHERKYTDVKDHTLSLAPHDGLIDSDLFLRCQERLDSNKQIDNRRKSQITWLTGLIKCGSCGYSIVPKTSNGGRYIYLYCTGKTVHSACNIKGNLGSLAAIEAIVEERIFRWSEKYSDLRATVEVAESKERNGLGIRIAEIDLKIERLIDLTLESNEVTVAALNQRITALSEERTALEDAMDKLCRNNRKTVSKEIADIAEEWGGLDIKQKNVIAELLISRINLSKDELEIEWKYDFQI